MINGLVDSLRNINYATYNDNLAINNLHCASNFPLSLAEIDHRLNQLQNGLGKLESDISTIYNHIDSLGNNIVTPTLISHVYLRTILNNMQKVTPKDLSLNINSN